MSKKKKYPDNVVWSLEKGFYANSLDYPTNVGAPAFKGNDIATWKKEKILKTNYYFQEKFEEIKKKYAEFVNELEWNTIIYSSKYNFEPIIGHSYYLYIGQNGEYFLSLIKPNEWNQKFVGEFALNSENIWHKK